jgi:carbonic anhydrase/acetyltransferase-like protein (isoleucine patch superfamily)
VICSLGDRHPVFEGTQHFVAENATIIGSVVLKHGASVWFNAVLRGDNDLIEIGRNSNVQDGAVLHTDPGIRLTIGESVTVGHQATLHGCTVGDNSLIGIGSCLLNNAVVGKNSIVGAHSLITENKDFPDGVLIVGSPAKVVRDLSEDEWSYLAAAAAIYVEKSARYRTQLNPVTID